MVVGLRLLADYPDLVARIPTPKAGAKPAAKPAAKPVAKLPAKPVAEKPPPATPATATKEHISRAVFDDSEGPPKPRCPFGQ